VRLSDERRERIARAIHESYVRDQAARKRADDLALAPWDELPEQLRRSSRRQVDDVFDKLEAIGCTVHEVRDRAEPISLTPDEVERLARLEHDRWVAERRASGWALGEPRDVGAKVTPHLVSWEDLAEDVREWDREPVRRIPQLLAEVGLEVRRERG
jgi:hypothetical protein